MFLSCVHLSISIQQVHKNFFSFFSSTSRLTAKFGNNRRFIMGQAFSFVAAVAQPPTLQDHRQVLLLLLHQVQLCPLLM
jgi:hypothetical protein